MLTYSFHFSPFNNLSVFRKNPSLTQFILEIYNKIIIKILGYFWGVTSGTSKIKGQGKVVLKMTFGKELTLTNVLYVPKI